MGGDGISQRAALWDSPYVQGHRPCIFLQSAGLQRPATCELRLAFIFRRLYAIP